MSNMTQIIPMRSQNIGFALDRRVLARWLAPELDECGATRRAEKISRSDQKKGG
jgi:hypothetical protein